MTVFILKSIIKKTIHTYIIVKSRGFIFKRKSLQNRL